MTPKGKGTGEATVVEGERDPAKDNRISLQERPLQGKCLPPLPLGIIMRVRH